MLKPMQIGLIGFGTVGSGTYQLLKRNQHQIQRRLGRALHISMVADLDTEKVKSVVDADCIVVSDANEIISRPDIDVVIELIGGYGFALEVVSKALQSGKHVVTANKALLATHGQTIFQLARKNACMACMNARESSLLKSCGWLMRTRPWLNSQWTKSMNAQPWSASQVKPDCAACQAARGNWSGLTCQPKACASAHSWAQHGLFAGMVMAC
jgi:hypothetical protein